MKLQINRIKVRFRTLTAPTCAARGPPFHEELMRTKLHRITLGCVLIAACSDDGSASSSASNTEAHAGNYVLGSVVIDPEGNRTTYIQTIDALDHGPYNNDHAIELTGNGSVLAHGRDFFAGHAEDPTWTRYSIDDDGTIEQTGELSLLDTGAMSVDYGNAIVDDETAVSVFSEQLIAVVWNPKTMQTIGEIDLSDLERDGYELEVWTTIAHDGLVYIPGRWSDWDGGRIYPGVSLTILDPKAMKVLGTAEDDRCASGGRVIFGKDGYGYVMGDGRTYSIQMFANANGETPPQNCLLRIAPGATDFDEDYFYSIPSLTGGLESITELDTSQQGSGAGFVKMFYPDKLPDDVKPVDFDFWDQPAHKMWQLELADPPTAKEVEDIPFGAVGFDGVALDGKYYSGESLDSGGSSEVYEIDPETNRAELRFEMTGYLYGLYKLER
jgi:hypothetical protein